MHKIKLHRDYTLHPCYQCTGLACNAFPVKAHQLPALNRQQLEKDVV